MKIDSVFVAFLIKDSKEHLLYKKENDLYIDLNTKEKFTNKDIDLNTLIYLRDALDEIRYKYDENMFKNSIRKLYNNDRKKLIDISSLVIVDVKKVTNLEKIYLGNDYNQYKWQSEFLYKALLKRYTSHSYEDIRVNRMYLGELVNMFHNGCLYVDDGKNSNIKYLRYEYPNLGSIEKKKVLELAYKLNKND